MDKIKINNNLEKIYRNEASNFLNPVEVSYIKKILDKSNLQYSIYKPFKDAEKQIIYTDKLGVSLFLISTKDNLSHREILGSLFSNQLRDDSFGDIIIDNDKYYILIKDHLKKYMLTNFNKIGKKSVKLIEKDLDCTKDFSNRYKTMNITTTSLRVDQIISKLISISRSKVLNMITDQMIMVNYEILKSKTKSISENDIISIRRYGKFIIRKIDIANKIRIDIDKYI